MQEEEEAPVQEEAPNDLENTFAGLRKIMEGGVSAEEVAQAIYLILYAMSLMKDEIDDALEQRGVDGDRAVRQLRTEIETKENEHDSVHTSLRSAVDSLAKWRKAQEQLSTADDASAALELAEEVDQELGKVKRQVSQLLARPPQDGKPGRPPEHKWEGTRLFFRNPDGSWAEGVDVRGPAAVSHPEHGGGFSGHARDLRPGSSNVRIENDRIFVDAPAATSQSIEEPTGIVNDANVAFGFTEKPFLVVVNGATYRENHGWTWNAGTLTATLSFPVGTGGDIYGIMQ